jgi:hypothetical protein
MFPTVDNCRRALKKGGILWLNLDDSKKHKDYTIVKEYAINNGFKLLEETHLILPSSPALKGKGLGQNRFELIMILEKL